MAKRDDRNLQMVQRITQRMPTSPETKAEYDNMLNSSGKMKNSVRRTFPKKAAVFFAKELMKLTLEQRIAHGGHKVIRRMMDSMFVRQEVSENIKMDKEKSTKKIDAAFATVMALDWAIRNGRSEGSVYDTRGILVFINKIITMYMGSVI